MPEILRAREPRLDGRVQSLERPRRTEEGDGGDDRDRKPGQARRATKGAEECDRKVDRPDGVTGGEREGNAANEDAG